MLQKKYKTISSYKLAQIIGGKNKHWYRKNWHTFGKLFGHR